MTQVPLLDELAIVAATAVVVTVVLSRLKLPTVAGLLAAGALLGPLPGLDDVRQLVSGRFHFCARTTAGIVHCWGGNGWGQLGAGGAHTSDFNGSPVTVPLRSPAVTLVGHATSTCALLEDGSLYCWGAQRERGALIHGKVCHDSVWGSMVGDNLRCVDEPERVYVPEDYVPYREAKR